MESFLLPILNIFPPSKPPLTISTLLLGQLKSSQDKILRGMLGATRSLGHGRYQYARGTGVVTSFRGARRADPFRCAYSVLCCLVGEDPHGRQAPVR